jgi:hypothetical protein
MGLANYDYIKSDIAAEYSGLGDEETRSGQICPACTGGASKEGSLSVTRRGDLLLFNCFRASCNAGGVVRLSATGGEASPRNEVLRRRVHIPVSRLDEATAKFLACKFGIPRKDIELAELGWTGKGTSIYARRVSYPIYGPDSRKRGTQYRSYEGKEPKAITRLDSDESIAFCWYKWKRTSKVLILVEDQMSAIKVAPHFHSAALLGTNISDAKVHEMLLQPEQYERIYLCLDNDATYEAVRQQLALRNRLKNLLVLGLPKDIKNMNDIEFKEYLERIS